MVGCYQQEQVKRWARHAKDVAQATSHMEGRGGDNHSIAIAESKDEMASRIARLQPT